MDKIDPKDVTGEVKEIFKQYANENGIKIIRCQIIETKMNNFMSDVSKCVLEGEIIKNGVAKEYKRHFIIKEIPVDKSYCEIYSCDVAFQNEYNAYKYTIPALQEHCVREIPVPTQIHMSQTLIILEDLSEERYTHINPLTDFTKDLVKKVLAELAHMHVASILLRHFEQEKFEEVVSTVKEVLFSWENKNKTLLNCLERCLEMAIILVKTSKDAEFRKKALQKLESLRGKTVQSQINIIHQHSECSVINHGDLWASNLMIKDGEIKFLDFQIMRYASLATDLSYFFNVNLDPEFYFTHHEEFLQFYLNELVNGLRNENADCKLDLESLKKEMKCYAPYGFLFALWILPVLYNGIKVEQKTEDVFVGQASASAEERLKNASTEEKERMMKLIENFVTFSSS